MYVLRKKYKGDNENEDITEPSTDESKDMITTVGLFAPKIVVDTVKVKPCFYTLRTTNKQKSSELDLTKIINAIDKDQKTREDCDFKILLASMNIDDTFDLDKEIYTNFKYINAQCQLTDGENNYKYNIPRSRDLADYVILMDINKRFKFSECTIGLPGDELKRGIEKLSDFEELTTHYPVSVVVKKSSG